MNMVRSTSSVIYGPPTVDQRHLPVHIFGRFSEGLEVGTPKL